MKGERTSKIGGGAKVIRVDFRGERLIIDDDPYLDRVTEIHCRVCERRRPRAGARSLRDTWGYVCRECREEKAASKKPGQTAEASPLQAIPSSERGIL